jgi:hypothetical protein
MKGLDLDIGLAPLADNPFNACKSPIKWLEFSALGMAGVYSAVPAYLGVIEQGKTGLLVDNVTEKWINAIKLLIDYPELRLELALAAQLKVYQEHSLQRQAQRVAGLYGRLIDSLGGGRAMAAVGDGGAGGRGDGEATGRGGRFLRPVADRPWLSGPGSALVRAAHGYLAGTGRIPPRRDLSGGARGRPGQQHQEPVATVPQGLGA